MAQYSEIAYDYDDRSGRGYAEVKVDDGDDVLDVHFADSGPQAVECRLNLAEARSLRDALAAAIQVAEYNNRN